MDHLTAKVSCFARAYHRRTNAVPVFDDTAAEALLGEDFPQIAQSMKDGAAFFLPGFTGTPEERVAIIMRPRLFTAFKRAVSARKRPSISAVSSILPSLGSEGFICSPMQISRRISAASFS